METVHNAIAWYQKKIGSYDKQLWEESVEKKLLKVPPNVKNAPKKSVRLKTEYIDVDLIRGSTFTKTKPQVPWIYITRKAIARVIFFPFYYKWWVLQTSIKLYLLLLVLYFLQLISIVVYLRNLDHSIVEDELSFTEVTLPVILMFLLCLVHSQTVLAHISHKPPKRTKTIPRVIRPQKTKKTTRKGHRSSGNNSSACQDDSCTSSRSTKRRPVSKPKVDTSSSSTASISKQQQQQASQDESFTFPESQSSTTKSSSNLTYSSVSTLVKDDKDLDLNEERSQKGDDVFSWGTKESEKDVDVVKDRNEREKVKDSDDKVEDKINVTGGENRGDRVFSLGFEPSENETPVNRTEERVSINPSGDLAQECVIDNSKGQASVPSETLSEVADTSSLVVETLKCGVCGNKKCDVSMVTGDSCQGYYMQQRKAVGNNICGGCNHDGRQEKENLLNGDINDTKLCICDGVSSSSGSSKEKYEDTVSRSGEKFSEGNDRVDGNVGKGVISNGKFSSTGNDSVALTKPTSSLQHQSPLPLNNEKSVENCGSKEYSYQYYCDNVTEDSGVHSNLSSADSVCSCHTSIPDLVTSAEGNDWSPPFSTSSTSSLTTQRENNNILCPLKNNERLAPSTTTNMINAMTANNTNLPLSPSRSNSNGATNDCDCDTIDLKGKEDDIRNQRNCSIHHHHHHHHHQHQDHRIPVVSITEVKPTPNQNAITAPPTSTSTSSSVTVAACSSTSTTTSSSLSGIHSFSEQFAHEILNSETLREVSSSILMNNSDLDCSSSSLTGPLSSASYSSSSSAFSTNNMFSLPLKGSSSATLTKGTQPSHSLISKRSNNTDAVSSTTANVNALRNSHSNIISSNNDGNTTIMADATTTASMTTSGPNVHVASNPATSFLNLPKRRHFASRLPINQQRHKSGKTRFGIKSSPLIDNDDDDQDENLEKLIEMDMMAAAVTTTTASDADRMSDISNYSPSESDSDATGMEDLRNRCEEKRRKQLRFQELSVNVHTGGVGGAVGGAGGSPKPTSPNGSGVSRSVVNSLTRKPSPLKDLSLSRKLNVGAAAQGSTHSSASDVGKSESTTRSCLRRRRRTSGNMGDVDATRTRSVSSSIAIGVADKNKMISSSENEGGEGYPAEGSNKATMSSEEWEDRIPLDESTSSNYSSSCGNSDSEEGVNPREGEEVEEEEEEKTEYTTSTLHVINLLQPQAGSPSNSGNASQPDKVSCLIWEMNECKKVDLTALDIGWAIIDKVDSLPESSDYFIIGMLFSVFMGLVPLAFRGFVNKSWANIEELLCWSGLVDKAMDIPNWFLMYTWRQNLLMFNGIVQRTVLSLLFFFLLSVADRTFKQRLLYAKHFSYLTSSRRARKFSMPHFRLNKVRNIKIWLSLRSYLKRRGPQRSVDVIVSASFMCGISVVCLISLQMLKDSGNYLDFLCNWELLVWCLALAIFLLRFMTLGLKINKKYRNLSVLITEQINLYLQMEQKPHKKEELVLANNVLRLAEDLLKELESPFKISGFSANPFIYNITKVIVLSAFSAVLTELLGFKLKLHKIKLKG